MMLQIPSNALLAGVACLVVYWPANTFAFSPPPPLSAAKWHPATSELPHHHSTSSSLSSYAQNRRSVFNNIFIIPSVTAATILTIPPLGDEQVYQARADEPNNIYYKSKADEEDPLAVFGRSLQQQSIITTTDYVQQQQPDSNKQGVKGGSESKATEKVFLPAGDLGIALQEKQQQRRIDPRTHG